MALHERQPMSKNGLLIRIAFIIAAVGGAGCTEKNFIPCLTSNFDNTQQHQDCMNKQLGKSAIINPFNGGNSADCIDKINVDGSPHMVRVQKGTTIRDLEVSNVDLNLNDNPQWLQGKLKDGSEVTCEVLDLTLEQK